MPKTAVIDNDFLNNLIDLRNHNDAYDIIVQFFAALDYKIVMHPLVFKHEKNPIYYPLMDRLFNEKVITVPELSELWSNISGGKTFYELMVKKVYSEFTGKQYPCHDVCGDWKKQDSLGEVHSVVMCIYMDCECFLSDDGEAVKYLGNATESATQKAVLIYDRQKCCDILKASGALNHNVLNIIGHKKKQ